MGEIVAKPSQTSGTSLSCVATALIATFCLRVALGPTPAHWLYILIPMSLLASLTLCLTQAPIASTIFKLEAVALLSAVYILSTAMLAQISAWHWSDKVGLAGFCLTTVLLGLEQSSKEDSPFA